MKTKLELILDVLRLGITFMILMMAGNSVAGRDLSPCEIGACSAQDTRLLHGFPCLKRSESGDALGSESYRFGRGTLAAAHSLVDDQVIDILHARRFHYQRIVEGLGATSFKIHARHSAKQTGDSHWVEILGEKAVHDRFADKFADEGKVALLKMLCIEVQPFEND